VAVLIGVGYLVAGLAGDRPGFGLFGLGLMLAVAVVFVVSTRWSETVDGLATRRDERINHLDQQATLAAGGVLIVAVIVMFMVEIARGESGSPYYQLGALAGLAYVVSLVWLRIRR
jgi:UDP-N-acetylmuramyl pentapeptide phosphotransferase/UDP-N-acetylglucosamine-1-phosphate transferase